MKKMLTNFILKKPQVLTITFIVLYFLGMGVINPAFLALDTLIRILFNGAIFVCLIWHCRGLNYSQY